MLSLKYLIRLGANRIPSPTNVHSSGKLALLICCLCLIAIQHAAMAGLTGDKVNFHRQGPSNTDDGVAIVGDGVEISWFSKLTLTNYLDSDVGGHGITITATANSPGNLGFGGSRSDAYFEFSDIDWIGDPSCKIIDLDVNLSNWSEKSTVVGDFSFADDSVRWNIGGLRVGDWLPGKTITLTWTLSNQVEPFTITAFSYDNAVQSVDLTFTSSTGVEYAIDASANGVNWSEVLADSIIGAAGEMTTVSGLPIPLPARESLLLRVREKTEEIELLRCHHVVYC